MAAATGEEPAGGGAGDAGAGQRPRERLPRPLWVVTALYALILLGYTVLLPTYRAPDEPQHVDLVLAMEQRFSYPNYDERLVSPAVLASEDLVRFGRGTSPWSGRKHRNRTADEAPSRDGRPSFSDLEGWSPPPTPAEIAQDPMRYRNYVAQHPPLYYELLGHVLGVIPGSSDWAFDQVVGFLRICNALLLVPIPWIVYRTLRRIGGSPHAALTASIVPLAVPQLAHIGGSVNNDNLLVLLAAIVTSLGARIAMGDLTGRTAVLTGLIGGMALLTKGFALFIPPWIAITYIAAARTTRNRSSAMSRGMLTLGVMTLVGGWWWIRNVVELGTLQPGIATRPLAPPGFEPDFAWWVRRFGAFLIERTWGWFGWLEVRMPLAAIVVATALVAIAWAAALGLRDAEGMRARLCILLLPLAMLALLVGVGAYRAYAATSVTAGLQGRYLFSAVVGVAVVAGQGLSRAAGRWGRYSPLGVLCGAIIMHVLAFQTLMTAYWGSPDATLADRVRALAAWAPWPGGLLSFGGVALIGLTIWMLAETVIHAAGGPRAIGKSA
jgi:4-amino-4-deoxy-L-arabinose transferase-like glycosyltransferase